MVHITARSRQSSPEGLIQAQQYSQPRGHLALASSMESFSCQLNVQDREERVSFKPENRGF